MHQKDLHKSTAAKAVHEMMVKLTAEKLTSTTRMIFSLDYEEIIPQTFLFAKQIGEISKARLPLLQ